jgi:hypothetical protein
MCCTIQNRVDSVSKDPTVSNVFLYSGPWTHRSAKFLLLLMVSLLLLMPAIICNIVDGILLRIVVVMAFTSFHLTMLVALTDSRTIELIFAGAA